MPEKPLTILLVRPHAAAVFAGIALNEGAHGIESLDLRPTPPPRGVWLLASPQLERLHRFTERTHRLGAQPMRGCSMSLAGPDSWRSRLLRVAPTVSDPERIARPRQCLVQAVAPLLYDGFVGGVGHVCGFSRRRERRQWSRLRIRNYRQLVEKLG